MGSWDLTVIARPWEDLRACSCCIEVGFLTRRFDLSIASCSGGKNDHDNPMLTFTIIACKRPTDTCLLLANSFCNRAQEKMFCIVQV